MILPLNFEASPSSAPRLRSTVTSEPTPTSSERFAGPEAWLHVYDLKGTKEANNKLQPLGLGLFHAGLELYGIELLGLLILGGTCFRWSFGGTPPGNPPITGIHPMSPCRGQVPSRSNM